MIFNRKWFRNMEGQVKSQRSLVIPMNFKLSSFISPHAVIDKPTTNSLHRTYIMGLHILQTGGQALG
jgi:hypothetical protein